MNIDTNDETYTTGVWVSHGDAELLIRMFPRSRRTHKFTTDGILVTDGGQVLARFMHCLAGARGLADAKGNPLDLSDEAKLAIFDYNLGSVEGVSIADRVLAKDTEFYAGAEAEEGN